MFRFPIVIDWDSIKILEKYMSYVEYSYRRKQPCTICNVQQRAQNEMQRFMDCILFKK